MEKKVIQFDYYNKNSVNEKIRNFFFNKLHHQIFGQEKLFESLTSKIFDKIRKKSGKNTKTGNISGNKFHYIILKSKQNILSRNMVKTTEV